MLSQDEVMTWIADESVLFAATISTEVLDIAVPGCPAWSLRELVWHLGHVQRFWAGVVCAGADVEPTFPTEERGPRDAASLDQWMRTSTQQLIQALRDVPWEAPAWTWWKQPRTVGAIARHQVQEAAVHRWDAQSAIGEPDLLPEAVAADGVEEFLGIAPQMRATPPITFTAIDLDRSFRLSDGAAATVSGTAADLVLLLHRRRGLDQVSVEGDRDAVERFLIPIG